MAFYCFIKLSNWIITCCTLFFTVLLAVSLRVVSAQNGYNYDRPEGVRPGGFQGSGTAPGFPSATTPSYASPAFPPNSAPGNGYNYPAQSDTDFSTGTLGTTGFPSQRPSTGAGQPYPGAQSGIPSGPTYPAAQPGNGGISPYPAAQSGNGGNSPYPAAGQPQRPTGPSAAGQRPSVIGGSSFGGSQPVPSAGFGPGAQNLGGGSSSAGSSSSSSQQDESQEGDYSAIPGEPEIDYPIYSEIPETSFDCNQQEYPGYYADVEARCQVFHICALNKTFDFLCPNGTIFSQEHLVCVWWNQFDCNSAPGLFANNANLYEGPQGGEAPIAQGQAPVSNDFTGTGVQAGAPYPAAGRPQAPTSFGSTGAGPTGPYPQGPSSYQPSAPASGYPSSSPTGSANYPTGPSQFPSTQGYPGAGAPPSNVPSSSYQPPQAFTPQADTPYPAAGTPQTPTREYLPPRRG